MVKGFSIARLPRIEFGSGARRQLPALAAGFGRRVLLVTGGRSLLEGPFWPEIDTGFSSAGLNVMVHRVPGEPSPEEIDAAVQRYRGREISAVVAIGGGSALDAGKAIAGLLIQGNPVLDHLEGVGPERPYHGPSVPFIAVPTTAGTGSEATKNAVLSRQGADGYKKSFRHERLVARYAVIDPDFLSTCPPRVIAGNGMDALTQLLESYLSLRSNPFCDALALDGMVQARDSLFVLYGDPGNAGAQAGMAYASLLSGITLAQVGLGSVHGLAAPLGAFFPIPHGAACGTLVAAATAVNIRALNAREPAHPALARYAHVGRLLTGEALPDDDQARAALVRLLEDWTERLHLLTLDQYGIRPEDHPGIVANSRGSSMKTNPIRLSDEEITAILEMRQQRPEPA
ncbi:Alcohol dehydrogenase [Thioalkalivibrio nitratireducens DSM 14787]|uniref:Alcohol dehydrogenase n=1 Tax=Thioalkalivibrio nitratireducens (strain DSM 14787 / UNIQEM 213 / ALEN2) TaxID=1255043 RepID=L0DSW5_THIND|nr:iron-containing alcohol dehydrogenase [Thioalkalivibrio nitratireducens]AGA32103.1 Alcohol dehydrogenase [Thioalkalivibrio nitratireducens DSM 14787]